MTSETEDNNIPHDENSPFSSLLDISPDSSSNNNIKVVSNLDDNKIPTSSINNENSDGKLQRPKFISDVRGRKTYYNMTFTDLTIIKDNFDTKTSFLPPVEEWKCSMNLPYGFEIGLNKCGLFYFINHNLCTTSNFFPNESHLLLMDSEDSYNDYKKLKIDIINENCEEQELYINSEVTSCFIVSLVKENSSFYKKILPGDFILSINDEHFEDSKDLYNYVLKNKQLVFEVYRSSYSLEGTQNGGKNLKSSFLSKERILSHLAKPVNVHFAEKPIIFQYQKIFIDNQQNVNIIEQKYDNILKIKLENGMTKTFKIQPKQTVFDLTCSILKKIHINNFDLFTIVISDPNISLKKYFYHSDFMEDVINYKKKNTSYECRIWVISLPNDLKTLKEESNHKLLEYLFYQIFNFIQNAAFYLNPRIGESGLLYMMGVCVTTKLIMDTINKLKRNIDTSLPEESNEEFFHRIIDSNLDYDSPDSITFINHECQIQFIYKLINNDNIKSQVEKNLKDLVTNELRRFIFANERSLESTSFKLGPKNYENMYLFSIRSQIAVLEFSKNNFFVGIYKFRVHVSECPGVNVSMPRIIGIPCDFFINITTGYGIEQGTNTYILINIIKRIIGILISYNIDGRKLLTIIAKKSKPLVMIVNSRECDNIVIILNNIFSNFLNKKNKKIMIFDFTNPRYRTPSKEIPPYNGTHITIPSIWNHIFQLNHFISAYSSFYKKYEVIPTRDNYDGEIDLFKLKKLNPFMIEFKGVSSQNSALFIRNSIDSCTSMVEEDNEFAKFSILTDEIDLRRRQSTIIRIDDNNNSVYMSAREKAISRKNGKEQEMLKNKKKKFKKGKSILKKK